MYFKNILSKFQSGFHKGFSTKHCLVLLLIERWKEIVDKVEAFGDLLTDLIKVFDVLSHDLLIAKLLSYAFLTSCISCSLTFTKIITDHVTNRKKRTKGVSSCSSWEAIEHCATTTFVQCFSL